MCGSWYVDALRHSYDCTLHCQYSSKIAEVRMYEQRPHQVVVARAEAGNLIEAYTQLLWLDQDVSEILKPGCS